MTDKKPEKENPEVNTSSDQETSGILGFPSALFINPMKFDKENRDYTRESNTNLANTSEIIDGMENVHLHTLSENPSESNIFSGRTPKSGDSLNFKNCLSSDLLQRLEEGSPIRSIKTRRSDKRTSDINLDNNECEEEDANRGSLQNSHSLFYVKNNDMNNHQEKKPNQKSLNFHFMHAATDDDQEREADNLQEEDYSNFTYRKNYNFQNKSPFSKRADTLPAQNYTRSTFSPPQFHTPKPMEHSIPENMDVNNYDAFKGRAQNQQVNFAGSNQGNMGGFNYEDYFKNMPLKHPLATQHRNHHTEDLEQYASNSTNFSNISKKLSPFNDEVAFFPKNYYNQNPQQVSNPKTIPNMTYTPITQSRGLNPIVSNQSHLKRGNLHPQIGKCTTHSNSSNNLNLLNPGHNPLLDSGNINTLNTVNTINNEYLVNPLNINFNINKIKKNANISNMSTVSQNPLTQPNLNSSSSNNDHSSQENSPKDSGNMSGRVNIHQNTQNTQNTHNNTHSNGNNKQIMYGKTGWVCSLCKNFNYESKFNNFKFIYFILVRVKCNRCGKPQVRPTDMKMNSQNVNMNVNKVVNNNQNVNASLNNFNRNKSPMENTSDNENTINSSNNPSDISPNLSNKANSADSKKKKKPFVERVGDWVCIKCKNLNFSFRVVCNRCQLTKVESEKLFEQYMKNLMNYVKINELLQNQIINQNTVCGMNSNISNSISNSNMSSNSNFYNMSSNCFQNSKGKVGSGTNATNGTPGNVNPGNMAQPSPGKTTGNLFSPRNNVSEQGTSDCLYNNEDYFTEDRFGKH